MKVDWPEEGLPCVRVSLPCHHLYPGIINTQTSPTSPLILALFECHLDFILHLPYCFHSPYVTVVKLSGACVGVLQL